MKPVDYRILVDETLQANEEVICSDWVNKEFIIFRRSDWENAPTFYFNKNGENQEGDIFLSKKQTGSDNTTCKLVNIEPIEKKKPTCNYHSPAKNYFEKPGEVSYWGWICTACFKEISPTGWEEV